MQLRKRVTIENLTLLAIIAGILSGIYLSPIVLELKWIGDVFIKLLKMIIVPLIFASVFVSIVSLGFLRHIKDLGGKTILYYLTTTGISVFTGLVIVNLLTPGRQNSFVQEAVNFEHKFKFSDLILSIFPANPIKSLAEGHVLQIIFFAILFGLSVLRVNTEKRKQIHLFFDGLNDAMITLARWVIKLTPLGVFSIVSYLVATKGLKPLLSLWEYVLAVVIGLGIHAVINLGLLAYFMGKVNPSSYFLKVREALLVAFSTASSSATLPVSLEVAEEKAKISKKSSRICSSFRSDDQHGRHGFI